MWIYGLCLMLAGALGAGLGYRLGSKVVHYRNDFDLVFGAYRKMERRIREMYPSETRSLGLLLKEHPIQNRKVSASVWYLLRVRNRLAHEEGLDRLSEAVRSRVAEHIQCLRSAGLI